ncbi:MAG TPA: hypothetical protein VFC39_00110 [Acidobacteriaceae bacterium]|nr:hypothetical protein [Acidobacteriaceae bacterium]
MSGMAWVLTAVLLVGAGMTYCLLRTNLIIDYRKLSGLSTAEISRAVPFWRAFLGLLGLAAIVFSIHALLIVNGVLK